MANYELVDQVADLIEDASEIDRSDALRVARAVLSIVERERRAALQEELREIRREIGDLGVTSPGGAYMRASALAILFNHEHVVTDAEPRG